MADRRVSGWLLGLAGVLLLLTGCVQEYALIPTAAIKGRVKSAPAGGSTVGIRVSMVGTSTDNVPHTADYAFCDVEGDFVLKTSRLGRGYVVARGTEYDIGFAPVYLEKYGDTVSIDRLIPATDAVELSVKTKGKTRFLVFEDDWGKFDTVHVVYGFKDYKLADGDALHDDGSLFDLDPVQDGMQVSGDYAAGDGVWTLYTDKLFSGSKTYGFVFDQDEGKVERDPYEESSDDDHSQVLVK